MDFIEKAGRSHLALLFAALLAGCAEPAVTGASSLSATASSAKPAPAVAPTASGSVAPQASASASAVPNEVIAVYKGAFDAKRKKVVLPSGVADPMWGTEKGKAGVGAGDATISLWADGRVTGELTGALGEITLEGQADPEEGGKRVVTASLTPKDAKGFRGVIAGTIEGGKLVGTLDCASRDANQVREAHLELAR